MPLTIPHLPGRPTHGRRTKEPMTMSTTIHSLLQEKIRGQDAEIARLNEERAEVRRQVFAELRDAAGSKLMGDWDDEDFVENVEDVADWLREQETSK